MLKCEMKGEQGGPILDPRWPQNTTVWLLGHPLEKTNLIYLFGDVALVLWFPDIAVHEPREDNMYRSFACKIAEV